MCLSVCVCGWFFVCVFKAALGCRVIGVGLADVIIVFIALVAQGLMYNDRRVAVCKDWLRCGGRCRTDGIRCGFEVSHNEFV